MSANFYLSSHANAHLHPRAAVVAARMEDFKHATEQELAWIEIWSASAMQKICKRLGLRQQVLATAIVYFRRFYLRNSYCETEPALVAAACCYVAAKAEETPVHVKSAVSEAKAVFNDMGLLNFTSDNNRLAEMEFYLIEELDFHLVVYHPYRSLVQLCGRDGNPNAGGEEGRQSRAAMLQMDDTALQMAWFIINDTFRSSICLIHPPHLTALAAIYLAFSLHPPRSAASLIEAPPPPPPPREGVAGRLRRQSLEATGTGNSSSTGSTSNSHGGLNSTSAAKPGPGGRTDPITFLAALQVDQTLVLEIVQEIVSLYELWARLESPSSSSPSRPASPLPAQRSQAGPDERVVQLIRRMQESRMRDLRDERQRAVQAATGGGGAQGRKVG
ncbi:hypothetical protein JCM1841_004273 [Sporobolomyces salmonicolor]